MCCLQCLHHRYFHHIPENKFLVVLQVLSFHNGHRVMLSRLYQSPSLLTPLTDCFVLALYKVWLESQHRHATIWLPSHNQECPGICSVPYTLKVQIPPPFLILGILQSLPCPLLKTGLFLLPDQLFAVTLSLWQ